MLEQLFPSRRGFSGEDIIFALNGEAQKRAAAGEPVINATVGALLDDRGRLVVLETVMKLWRDLGDMEVAPYAPITGDPAFLTALTERHWPGLAAPGAGCATPGGSGALAISVRNFLAPGMAVAAMAPYWGPYDTLSSEGGAWIAPLPYPAADGALDAAAWEKTLKDLMASQGRVLLWLNDPCHNPTGRSLTKAARAAVFTLLSDLAKLGPVTLLLDLAYLDYTCEPQAVREALDEYRAFAEKGSVLVGAALSISKSLTLYGGRGGALVFSWTKDAALQAALAVSCRGLFSNCPRAPQSLVVKLNRDGKAQEALAAEHKHWSEVLEARARALDAALRAKGLAGAPWQGGFFVTLPVEDPMGVCERLKTHGVFVVPTPWGLRVGICGLRAGDAPRFAAALKESL
ncbi:MAG TPA: aminotransferase class I/II-fold pyridoxal phosphate-dependent enzyme [Holophagaceae bacterium]|jgi:aromatic-amino-acid transaminase|nr:aminotransferase class I/II-fold pyridoxal phosphate-dependent enzyme [Holophagaceae bacterium]